jgi:hypothetical protein
MTTTEYDHAHIRTCTVLVEHSETRVERRALPLVMTYLNGCEDKPMCRVRTTKTRMVSTSTMCPATKTYKSELWGTQTTRLEHAHREQPKRSEGVSKKANNTQ